MSHMALSTGFSPLAKTAEISGMSDIGAGQACRPPHGETKGLALLCAPHTSPVRLHGPYMGPAAAERSEKNRRFAPGLTALRACAIHPRRRAPAGNAPRVRSPAS